MDKVIKNLSKLDWILGGATLAYGVATMNLFIAAVGVMSLLIAWFKPAVRIKAALEKRFFARKVEKSGVLATRSALAEDAFYAEHLGAAEVELPPAAAESPAAISAPAPLPSFLVTLPSGPYSLHSSRHNQLRPAHLNLFVGPDQKRVWG